MTDGAARVIEAHAPPELRERFLPRLAARSLGSLFQGAMFLTEKQGGSDVGATTTRAVEEMDGTWRLHGDKWFCSKVDADVILALARPEGAPEGTRGLGLFLVPKLLLNGGRNAIRIHRLKDKLGVRSMPTGEVTLSGAVAYRIGGPGDGFKQMLEMVNLSRLYNAVDSVAVVRRALVEAVHYGRGRRAFGRAVLDHPLQRAVLGETVARHLGSLLMVFEAVRALDDADAGDAEAVRLLRALTPMCKAFTGKLAVEGVSECMEAIGGNAYVEESPLPRLLRDAQVLPIWEGTTNIVSLDLLRALQIDGTLAALHARKRRALESARGTDAAVKDAVAKAYDSAAATAVAVLSAPREGAERAARSMLWGLARAFQAALALEDESTAAAAGVLAGRGLDVQDEATLLERVVEG